MFNKKAVFCFILFILIDLISMRGILSNTSQLAYGDFSPFPQSTVQVLDDIRFAWRPVSLGMYRDPVNFQSVFQWIFLLIFKTPLVAQKVFIFLVPIIAYLSFISFIRYLTKGTPLRYPHAFIIGLLYSFSPVMLSEFIGGTLYSTMLIFAFFPLIYLLTMKLIFENKIFNTVALGLLLGGLAAVYPHLFIIYSLSLIIPSLIHLWFNGFKKTFVLWLRFIPVAVFAALTNPIFFLSAFSIISPVDTNGGASAFVNSFDTFIKDIHYTYTWSTFLNVLRLGNNYTPLGYTDLNAWTVAFYIPVFFVFIYAIKNFRQMLREKQVFLLTCFVSWLALIFGIYLIHLNALDFVFKLLPVLFIFRNPAKLTALTTFFFTVLLYKALLDLQGYKFRKVIYRFLFGLIIITIVVYMWPLFTMDRGLSMVRTGSLIPEYYDEVAQILNKSNDTQRVVWLPASHETTSIKLVWLSRNNVEAQLGLDNFSDSNFSPSLVTNLMDGITMNSKELINNVLRMAQIKYVVVLKNTPNGVNFVNALSYLKEVSSNEKYVIYEVSNVYPKVLLNPSISLYSNDSYAAPSVVNANTFNGFINVKDIKNLDIINEIPNVKNYFVTTKKVSMPIDTTNYYWENNHWSWPQSRISIDDPRYLLVKGKETIGLAYTRSLMKRMEYLLWLASKRVEEVRTYPEITITPRIKALDDAYAKLSEINALLRTAPVSSRSSDYYAFINKYTKYLERMYFLLGSSSDYSFDLPIFSVYSDLIAFVDTSSSNIKCLSYCYKVTPEFLGTYNILSNESKLKIVSKTNLENSKILDSGWFDYGTTSISVASEPQIINIQRELLPNLIDTQTWYDQNLSFSDADLTFDSQSFAPAGSIVKFQKINNWKPDTTYEISLDYNLKDGVFGYAVIEKLDIARPNLQPKIKPYGYVVSDNFALDFDQKTFNSTDLNNTFCSKVDGTRCYFKYSKTFTSSDHSKDGYLIVYNYAKKSSISQNKILNLRVNEVTEPLVFLKQDHTTFTAQQAVPEITKLNPSLYQVKIDKLSGSNLLVFNESYNSGWKLVDSQGNIADAPHFKINSYANAWLLRQDSLKSSESFYIKFMPQNYVDVSIKITIITYAAGLISLLVLRIKKW